VSRCPLLIDARPLLHASQLHEYASPTDYPHTKRASLDCGANALLTPYLKTTSPLFEDDHTILSFFLIIYD